MSAPVVRFAPSPTGRIHIGNARTALLNYLFAARQGGTFILRFDDTDVARSTDEFARSIEIDLGWLGIAPQATFRQSDRIALYEKAADRLKAAGSLYPAYETPGELDRRRKLQQARGLPPVYDRAALRLSPEERARLEAEGRKPHWRFLMKDEPIVWQDKIRGEVRFEGRDMSDPVLIREDGTPLYHLCSVIDDADFGITNIVRGEDHVSNTASHIQMFEAMGVKPPEFAHLPLISDAEGGKLSKRLGALSIIQLRDEVGLEPLSISSLLARLGTSDPIEAYSDYKDLIGSFDFAKFGRGTPKFDQDELLRLNSKILHELDYSRAKIRLAQIGLEEITEEFWNVVRPNLEKITDIREWWTVANGPVSPIVADSEFAAKAIELMPPSPWTPDTWKQWTDAIKTSTGRKGKELFMPLRQALTGMDHGPELGNLLPLIGPEKAKARLLKQAA